MTFRPGSAVLPLVPNLITLARLFSVPLMVWLVIKEHFDWSFWLFVAAALTDALDGFLARRLGLRSTVGAFLDPLASTRRCSSASMSRSVMRAISPNGW